MLPNRWAAAAKATIQARRHRPYFNARVPLRTCQGVPPQPARPARRPEGAAVGPAVVFLASRACELAVACCMAHVLAGTAELCGASAGQVALAAAGGADGPADVEAVPAGVVVGKDGQRWSNMVELGGWSGCSCSILLLHCNTGSCDTTELQHPVTDTDCLFTV